MTIIVPIYWIDRNGQMGADMINCSPCVRMIVKDAESGIQKKVFALIDTGADSVWLDDNLATDLGATARAHEMSYTANSRHMTGVYEGRFEFEGVSGTMTSRYLTSALRSNNRHYDAVLGRSVLTYFQLAWDGPGRTAQLLFPGR